MNMGERMDRGLWAAGGLTQNRGRRSPPRGEVHLRPNRGDRVTEMRKGQEVLGLGGKKSMYV